MAEKTISIISITAGITPETGGVDEISMQVAGNPVTLEQLTVALNLAIKSVVIKMSEIIRGRETEVANLRAQLEEMSIQDTTEKLEGILQQETPEKVDSALPQT